MRDEVYWAYIDIVKWKCKIDYLLMINKRYVLRILNENYDG